MKCLIFHLTSTHIPLIGHPREPKNCWLPIEKMTEMMLVPKVDGEFKGLKLPGEVVDIIYRTNAEKWFPGIVKSKPYY